MRLALALLCAAILAGCKVEADLSGDLPIKTLSAEEYQQEIASIDRLLFKESPLGDDGVRALENTLEAVAKRVGQADANSKFLKLESLELRLLAKRAGRLSQQGTGKALQNDWMRIRNNLFDDRAWFVRSAADLDYAASVIPPPAPASAPQPQAVVTFSQPETEHRSTLTGRWQVVEVIANGERRFDEDLSDSIWNFQSPRVTLSKLSGKEATFEYTIADGYFFLNGPEKAWVKYQFDSQGLRLAVFDGGRGRPESFEWSGQKDPMLMVLRLVALREGAGHVARVAAPPPAPVPPPVTRPMTDSELMERRLALKGRWQVVSVMKNGKLTEDKEISGSIWNFQPPGLSVLDGNGKSATFSCGIDGDYLGLIGKDREGWMKYEIGPDGLRVAFYNNLTMEKPPSFEWSGHEPTLIVVRLVALR